MTTNDPAKVDVSDPKEPDTSLTSEKIWDLPTRLFHWSLATTVIIGWYLGQFREFSTINWHFYLGYITGSLLVFRLFWGFYGPPAALFKNIVPTRREIFSYAKRITSKKPSGVAGHNPLGGLSVVALLIVLSIQVIAGFFSEDDSLFASGPMAKHVSSNWVLFANDIHHKASRIILILIALHLAAIVFYQVWKKENLIWPMISGWKMVRIRKP